MPRWQLCISNIGWEAAADGEVYAAMQAAGFTGLELAPTRLFPAAPYDHLQEAARFAADLRERWGFTVPSIQSIWYGQTGSIWQPQQAEALLAYTERAYAFAAALGCPSLVFGCPRNRRLPDGHEQDPALHAAAEDFLDRAGTLAARAGVRLALEANAPSYTNYLTTTAQVFALVKRLGNPGLAVNFDLGNVLENGEVLEDFAADFAWVSHVHISEPGLVPPRRRPEHARLAALLRAVGYGGAVSVEMARTDPATVRSILSYAAEVFA